MGLVEGGSEGKHEWRFRFALSDGRRYEERLESPTLPAWLVPTKTKRVESVSIAGR
jgi:hypothetical protein